MADKKISALTASTTPLAGTEVLPIVQSGATVKVAVSDLTAGRNVGMAGATSTDDLKVSAGKGLAYSGNTATRMSPEDNVQGALIAAGGSFKVTVGGGTNAFNIDGTTANATVNTGNLVIGTSGKGIDFSATPGTGTSELFADYEEGTWTPVATWATQGSGTSSGNAYYTKVGRAITLLMYITATKGTASGNFTVTGIPYAPATSAACAYRIDGMGAALTVIGVNITSTTMNFSLMNQSTVYASNVTAAAMANDCYIQVTCTYNI